MVAGQGKIFEVIASAMLAGDDVVDVVGKEGFCRLRQAAVFTTVGGPFADELPQPLIHQAA
jgi:hypothetical protein